MIIALLISFMLFSLPDVGPKDTAALQSGRPEAAGDNRGQSPLNEEGAEAGASALDIS